MGSPQDFKSLQEGIQKQLVSAVKIVNRIAAEDLGFQRTVKPDTADQLDDKSTRVLELSARLLGSAAKACGVKAPSIEDAEDIDMSWQSIVDVVDSVLEKADTALDEYTGLIKRKEPPSADPGHKSKRTKSAAKVIRNANVTKPQTMFEKKPDNFPTGPWKPILTDKPHAKVSLDKSLVTVNGDDGPPHYKHPYEAEISKSNYPKQVFQKKEAIPSKPADSTQAIWVDTFDGVRQMLEDLKKVKEIAVDLEHHDFRTYTGLVCLMQVSTREKDWIVDTLQPWRHKLEILNEVFADPSIVKVFHGAYMDMVWLQRDLGLYVNGLFDTYFACDLLHYPGKSLAFLLSKFVDFDADKQYQLADWRIRPIPEEMLYYARSDTHYLLYIYDHVRNELVEASNRSDSETDMINQALEKSRELSLSRHEHPDYNETTGEGSRGWYNYVFKHSHLAFDGEQFSVFKALWKWRDETARKEDESPNFVLGTTNVMEIARVNPPDVKALHSLLPLTAPLARARLNDIWSRVQSAKSQGGPSLMQFFTSMAPATITKSRLSKLIKDPVQLSHLEGAEVSVGRMPRTKLFGSMPISSRWEESKESSGDDEDSIPFPWQRFVDESATLEEAQEYQSIDQAMEDPQTAADTSKANAEILEDRDEEFTLKRGRKRKPESDPDEDDETSSSSDDEPQPGSFQEAADADTVTGANTDGVIAMEDDAPRRSKKQRRLERKQKQEEQELERAKKRDVKLTRKARKQAKQAQNQEVQKKNYQAVPFDYSTAATVMHAGRGNAPGKEPKKVFDPYAKTGDEPIKGARKMPPVRGERSATFKK
ncbi:exosome nuclease subunit [Conoideocrella luteorostrata]|uniref:Exosome nuclease subunit n=1 Tax=Conoideocrella luteorostrata TaxID=1105319 RepID=A0AAJ0FY04_9HYPO|nr:exosome nuclease subunit [Conoideocrella luteorostrata]